MWRILFVLYLPLMLAPVPVGAAEKKGATKRADKAEPEMADNYEIGDLSYTLEIKVKSATKRAPAKKSNSKD